MAEDTATWSKEKLEFEAKELEAKELKAKELEAKKAAEQKEKLEVKYGKEEKWDDGHEDRKLQLEWHQRKLTHLHEKIGRLAALSRVEWAEQQLTYLPDDIGRLKQLQHFDVSCNKLTSLPATLCDLTLLTDLLASENQLSSLPESLGKLEKLQKLDVFNNMLSSLPESIDRLVSLLELNVGCNKLTSLPEQIGSLRSLKSLRVDTNCLTSLPESIGELVLLQHLSVSHNQLTKLPNKLGKLVNLQYLYVVHNNLTSLPDNIGSLTELKYLHVYNNRLTSIPDSVDDLQFLESLDAHNNFISIFSTKLKNLKYLGCENQNRKEKSVETLTTESPGKKSYLEQKLKKFKPFKREPVDVVIDKLVEKDVLTLPEKAKLQAAADLDQRVTDLMSILEIKADVDVDKFLNVFTEESVVTPGQDTGLSKPSISTSVEARSQEGGEPMLGSESEHVTTERVTSEHVTSEEDTYVVGCTDEEIGQLVQKFEDLKSSEDVPIGSTYGTDVFVIGDFDERGGFLVLRKMSAYMEVPRGALKQRKTVYFCVVVDSDREGVCSTFSLVYKCGPHGTTFDQPVMLQIPHSLKGDSNLVNILTREECSFEWVISKGTKLSFESDRATLEIPHFCRFLVGVLKEVSAVASAVKSAIFKCLFASKERTKVLYVSYVVKGKVATFHLMEPSLYKVFKEKWKSKGHCAKKRSYLFYDTKGCLIVEDSDKKDTNRATFDAERCMNLSSLSPVQKNDLLLADEKEITLFCVRQELDNIRQRTIAIPRHMANALPAPAEQGVDRLSLDPIDKDTRANADKRNLFRWEFKTSFGVPLARELVKAAESVCLISYRCGVGSVICGTGFRVGEKYVLTAWHVVKRILEVETSSLRDTKVIFDYNFDPTPEFDKTFNPTGNYCKVDNLDTVILEMKPKSVNESHSLPLKLATNPVHFFEDPEVYVIGHPKGKHKRLDKPCGVHTLSHSEQMRLKEDVNYKGMIDKQFLLYDCTLEDGASGGPVLSFDGQTLTVVAFHAEGFPKERKSVPRYMQYEAGVRISEIHEHLQDVSKYSIVSTDSNVQGVSTYSNVFRP